MIVRSDGVVVITSASHAEGREFKPRSDLFLPEEKSSSFLFCFSFFSKKYKGIQSFKADNIQTNKQASKKKILFSFQIKERERDLVGSLDGQGAERNDPI